MGGKKCTVCHSIIGPDNISTMDDYGNLTHLACGDKGLRAQVVLQERIVALEADNELLVTALTNVRNSMAKEIAKGIYPSIADMQVWEMRLETALNGQQWPMDAIVEEVLRADNAKLRAAHDAVIQAATERVKWCSDWDGKCTEPANATCDFRDICNALDVLDKEAT